MQVNIENSSTDLFAREVFRAFLLVKFWMELIHL